MLSLIVLPPLRQRTGEPSCVLPSQERGKRRGTIGFGPNPGWFFATDLAKTFIAKTISKWATRADSSDFNGTVT
jgi:hypothetical protein